MRTQRTLRDGVKLSLASALAATLLVPSGCKQVEDIADKVKGEEAKDESEDKKEETEDKKEETKEEAAPEEKSADPKVDPTPVKEEEIEAVPVEELHTGLDLMLKMVPSDKAEFVIARDPTVFADYMEQGVKFMDGPIEKLTGGEAGNPAMMAELGDLVEAYREVSKFHDKVAPAIDSSGLLPKEGMAWIEENNAEYVVFNGGDPTALQKFVEAIEPGKGENFSHCKAIDGLEGWNVCSKKEGDLGGYKPADDPKPLRDKLTGRVPGIELDDANIIVQMAPDGKPIDAAVTTIPGSIHVAVAMPEGGKEVDELSKALSVGEAKTLANVAPGAGFIWGHVEPKLLEEALKGMGSDAPPPAKDFVGSMTGDFVFAGTVDPGGVVLQAGVSDASKFAGVLTLAEMMSSEVPKELPELGNAKLTFEKLAIEGGGNKADALHVGVTGINEADILKSYTGLHMDAWAFASGDVFTLALGPNTEGVGKLLETKGTGPSEELLAALPPELADGLKKKEVSFAMHMPMDFLQGKQMHDLVASALKEVPDAKPEQVLSLLSLASPLSNASMWMAQPDGKMVFHASVHGIGNTETEEGKVALEAAHKVVDGAEPEAEFGPIATKFAASPMAYAYKARAGSEGPGYMIGSGVGAVAAAALVAVPVAMGSANAALADDLGVTPDAPEPEIVEPTPPKPVKTTKKPAEPKKPKKDPKKDEPKKDPKKDEPKEDPKKDDPKRPTGGDDGGKDKPLPPKPTPDAPDPDEPRKRRLGRGGGR